jgi:hypothetical protein
MGIDSGYELVIASGARRSKSEHLKKVLFEFEGATITMPTRFAPGAEFLEWHLEHIFKN